MPVPHLYWKTDDIKFDEVTVIGNELLPRGNLLVTSRSYKLGDFSEICIEEPMLEPVEEAAEEVWAYIAALADEYLPNP